MFPRARVSKLLVFAATAALPSCTEEKPSSAWPTETAQPTKVETTAEEERVDLYGDSLPSGAVARLGSVRMFDRKLGKAIFSADGSEIISSSEESYLIWQTTTAQRLGALEVAAAAPAMAMRGDGKLLATALYGGGIQFWDYAARKRGKVITGHRKVASSMCFAGETLVSGSEDRSLRIWAEKPIVLRGDWEAVAAVHCRQSGVILFGDTQGAVWLTDLSGAEPARLGFGKKKPDAGTPVTDVSMGSDKGPFVAALGDGSIAIWSAVKAVPQRFDAHTARALKVAFTADGQLMSSGADAVFRFWDPSTAEKLSERKAAADVEAQLFEISEDGAFVVAFSELKDGRASEAGRFWLYDGSKGTQLLEPQRHTEALTKVAFSSDGKSVVSASLDGKVFVWNARDASRTSVLSKHKGAVRGLARGTTGPWFSVGDDARMHTSKIGSGDSIIFEPLGGAIHALAVEPSGQRLVIGDFAGKVTSYSRKSGGRLVRHDSEAFSTIHEIAFSPDGKVFVIAGGNRHMHVISSSSGKKVTLLSPPDVVANHALSFSPDGKLLASGGDDHVVRLWNTATWKQVAALEGHDGTIRTVAFSPDSARLSSGASDEVARVWDVSSQSEITLLAGHRGAVTSVAFSPDGTLLATGSRDRTALVWELPKAPAKAPATAPAKAPATPPAKAPAPASAKATEDPAAASKSDAAP